MGLRDESTQRALLTVPNLTFVEALRIANAREKAAKDVNEIGSKSSTRSVNYVNNGKNHRFSGKKNVSNEPTEFDNDFPFQNIDQRRNT